MVSRICCYNNTPISLNICTFPWSFHVYTIIWRKYYCNSIFLRPNQVKKSCTTFSSDKHLLRYCKLNIEKITKFSLNISKSIRQIKKCFRQKLFILISRKRWYNKKEGFYCNNLARILLGLTQVPDPKSNKIVYWSTLNLYLKHFSNKLILSEIIIAEMIGTSNKSPCLFHT